MKPSVSPPEIGPDFEATGIEVSVRPRASGPPLVVILGPLNLSAQESDRIHQAALAGYAAGYAAREAESDALTEAQAQLGAENRPPWR